VGVPKGGIKVRPISLQTSGPEGNLWGHPKPVANAAVAGVSRGSRVRIHGSVGTH
jgi:hypothetical protein